MTKGPIGLIEASYTAFPDDGSWLENLVQASAPYDLGPGVLACTIDLGARSSIAASAASGDAGAALEPIRALVANMSAPTARRVFSPVEFVGNATWRLNRLASAGPAANDLALRTELPPFWGLVSGDGKTRALMVAFLAPKEGFAAELAFPHEDSRVLGLVGAHLSSALRLRSRLPTIDENDAAPEAILDPEGRVLDARGSARNLEERRSLSEAVVNAERARGQLRKTDAAGAAELWQALVEGRWSIVETVERNGKRLLLARANPQGTPDLTALTKDESDVVWLTALGHSYKFIGYELGFTPSSVARRLSSAMLKLGVSTRQELIRKLGR